MIIKLSELHISEVVHIHKKNLPSLLAFYSNKFIEKFYKHHLNKPDDTILLGFQKEDILCGFAFGTFDLKDMFGSFIKENKVFFFMETLKTLVRYPKYLLYIFQSLFSKNDTSKDSNTQLVYIAVDKRFEKMGIGKSLLDAFDVAVLAERSYYELEVEQNNPALGFYKNNGFFIIREINNILEKKYLMRKNLK